jgi:hypothetical protein
VEGFVLWSTYTCVNEKDIMEPRAIRGTRDFLGHNSPGAGGKLVDAPELLGLSLPGQCGGPIGLME